MTAYDLAIIGVGIAGLGRVGVYPRDGETWVGPTDEPHDGPPDSACVSPQEQEDLRRALALVLPELAARPCRAVMGLRPIPRRGGAAFLLSREHRLFDHADEGLSNFLTVAGGKLTTYRPMGEDVLAAVMKKLGRPAGARPPAEEGDGMPWPLIRAGGLAASAGLLSYYAVRRAVLGAR
jgi:glycerol-3-phosphate dehydrogenase